MTKEQKIRVILDYATENEFGIYPDYSGRGMMGKKCLCIRLPYPLIGGGNPLKTRSINEKSYAHVEELTKLGIGVPNFDNIDEDTLLYWPELEFGGKLLTEAKATQDEEEAILAKKREEFIAKLPRDKDGNVILNPSKKKTS